MVSPKDSLRLRVGSADHVTAPTEKPEPEGPSHPIIDRRLAFLTLTLMMLLLAACNGSKTDSDGAVGGYLDALARGGQGEFFVNDRAAVAFVQQFCKENAQPIDAVDRIVVRFCNDDALLNVDVLSVSTEKSERDVAVGPPDTAPNVTEGPAWTYTDSAGTTWTVADDAYISFVHGKPEVIGNADDYADTGDCVGLQSLLDTFSGPAPNDPIANNENSAVAAYVADKMAEQGC
jgi:hypothetical protein